MKIKIFAGATLCAALVTACTQEIHTLPQEPAVAPMPQPSRRIVVASALSEYVPPPLAAELAACKADLAQMTRDRDTAISRGGTLEKRVHELEGQAARVTALEKQLADEMQTGRDLQQRLARLEQDAAQSRESEQRLTQELEAAKKKASETQVANQQQIELAEQEISRRKAALAETTKHLATLDQDKQKIAAALAESQHRLDQLTADLSAEQAKTTSLSQENQRLGKSQDSLKKALEAEQASTASLSQENQRLGQSYEVLKKSLEAELADRDLKLREAQSRIVVTILDHVLFDSGQATLKPSGRKVLDQLSRGLKKISDKEIHVEGHTDNRPIRGPLSKHYPTNWELSAARATTVVRYFIEQAGLPADNLSAVGYADTKPVAANDTDASRGENRRIEILLYPKGLPKTAQSLSQ